MTDTQPLAFPDGFMWGVATSAYQIEGAASEDGRGPSIWDTFSHTPGKVLNGDTGDVAADHYHRFVEDVALMADIGIQAYRFSVSWPRVIPRGEGEVNRAGLDFYSRLVDELLAAGIEPLITLYHWDLPQALQDRGGWLERSTASAFARYAEAVFGALHDRVRWWSTHNEPWVAAFLGHYNGMFAPGITDLQAALTAQHHLLLSHGLAVRAMRDIDPSPQQGIVLNLELARSLEDDPVVVDAVRRVEGLLDRSFCDPLFLGRYPADVIADLAPAAYPVVAGDLDVISTALDWFGVNYYRPQLLKRTTDGDAEMLGFVFPGCETVTGTAADYPVTDMGWPVEPRGLVDLLTWLDTTYPNLPPMLVTENGCAYDDAIDPDGRIRDERRIGYLRAHAAALQEAIGKGIDVRGYMVWSLLDNFEWSSGYSKRFGLVHVDYDTLARTPRDSAAWYRALIAANALHG